MYTGSMQENFDPRTIQDEDLRQVVIDLMNMVETLSTKVQEQVEEIQRLRDENHRLKGPRSAQRGCGRASPDLMSESCSEPALSP